MSDHPLDDFIPYQLPKRTEAEMQARSQQYRALLEQRRSVRSFSDRPVARELIEEIIMTASSAPSGAHKQPWTFCVVSDPMLKSKIRVAAEQEEYENYHGRMSEEWLADLRVFGTDWQKPFLEVAPYLIVVFRRLYEVDAAGERHKNYYVTESVGLACGFLLTAIHQAGLASLTHTPSPMNFLQQLLQRPDNERPFLLIPVGYPAAQARVPQLQRKPASAVISWYE